MPRRRRPGAGLGMAGLSAAAFSTSGPLGRALTAVGWSPGAAVATLAGVAAAVLAVPAVLLLRSRWQDLWRHAGLAVAYRLLGVAGCQVCFFNAGAAAARSVHRRGTGGPPPELAGPRRRASRRGHGGRRSHRDHRCPRVGGQAGLVRRPVGGGFRRPDGVAAAGPASRPHAARRRRLDPRRGCRRPHRYASLPSPGPLSWRRRASLRPVSAGAIHPGNRQEEQ
jgi:hypothetical protein